jgi:hypothetical protein
MIWGGGWGGVGENEESDCTSLCLGRIEMWIW